MSRVAREFTLQNPLFKILTDSVNMGDEKSEIINQVNRHNGYV